MAEQIVNEFTVNRPIDEAWPIICDLERIAPCMPGAQLDEIEGETHRGRVKVKLGAVATEFKGEAHFVERDDDAHTAKLVGKGRDTKGRGNASADISATAEALSPTSTKCTVVADIHITGKIAQFGRGILGDVSKKLVDQFANNLNEMLDEQPTSDEPTPADTSAATADTSATSDEPAADRSSNDEPAPKVRRIEGPAAEPVDLADMAGPAVAKRVVPVVIAVLLLLLLLRRRGS
ncbi:MAG: carbon monoxide dehydrogenase [Acidimicrobiaceae bacterium]|nr:carbon monoxide dehydrogenase [Acidimicrobiaceae bacterium]